MADFRLWSDEFPTNGFMSKAQEYHDKAFGVDGENISPSLQWEAPPEGTQSFALTVHDPDAPTGSERTSAGIFTTTQCQKPLPVGASGS
jgi:phosphatidylethanolamine-binding protein (PEBP) family uncharacterized protein